MYLGGHSRWVPLVIGRTWNDLSQNVTVQVRHGLRYFLAQNLVSKVSKHRTQIELTQNTSQLSDHIMR